MMPVQNFDAFNLSNKPRNSTSSNSSNQILTAALGGLIVIENPMVMNLGTGVEDPYLTLLGRACIKYEQWQGSHNVKSVEIELSQGSNQTV